MYLASMRLKEEARETAGPGELSFRFISCEGTRPQMLIGNCNQLPSSLTLRWRASEQDFDSDHPQATAFLFVPRKPLCGPPKL
jgi:hypothetical protein